MKTLSTTTAGIYKITNTITNQVYIGSSKNLRRRINKYFEPSVGVNNNCRDSILQYGIENHKFRILCEFDNNISKKELETYEDGFILINLSRHGEEKLLNKVCNDKQKWMGKDYITNSKKILRDNTRVEVNQFTKDGIFIKRWEAISDLDSFFSKTVQPNISLVCQGKMKTAYGFKWSYAN